VVVISVVPAVYLALGSPYGSRGIVMKQLSHDYWTATIITMALTILVGIWITLAHKVRQPRAPALRDPAIATVGCTVLWHATIASALYLWRRTRLFSAWTPASASPWKVSSFFIISRHHRSILGATGLGGVVGVGRATHVDGDPRLLGTR